MFSTTRATSRSSRSSCSLVSVMVRSSLGATARRSQSVLCLQVAVHEVDLLESAKALADVLRPNLAHSLDRLQLGVGCGEHLVQSTEVAHDVRHDDPRKARDAAEDAIAPRRDGIVQGVELAVVAQDLGQAAEVEEVLVRQATDLVERAGKRVVGVVGEVVVDERGL